MYFAYITARVHQMIMQQCGMQQQQPGTVTHSHISSLLISRRLTRPRVASRYSVRPEGSATARLGVRDFEIHWISRGFRISQWISGFHSGFLDFSLDFWTSVWISAAGQVSSCMFLVIAVADLGGGG